MVNLKFWKRKDEDKEYELNIVGNMALNEAVQSANQMHLAREYGPDYYIVKDDMLNALLLSLGFNQVLDEEGRVVGLEVKDYTFASLYCLLNTVSLTGNISPELARYLKAKVSKILSRKKINLKIQGNGHEENILEDFNLIELVEELCYIAIDSMIEGRRVKALKTGAREVKAVIERRKEKGGGLI